MLFRTHRSVQRLGVCCAAVVSICAWTVTGAIAQISLAPADLEADDRIGQGVSIDGDTAVASSLTDDGVAGVNQGSVSVFRWNGSAWIEEAKLFPNDAAANKQFGESVAISGDTIVVGMTLDNTVSTQAGAAYVFLRTAGVWTQQAKLLPSDGHVFKFFGFACDIDGDTVVVGGHRDDEFGESAGAAYVFTRTGTVWTEQAKLTPADPTAEDNFGISVSISGDTIVAGAWQDGDMTTTKSGSAYVFTRAGTTWTEQAKLTADDAATDDLFGWAVDVSNDTAIVGAYDDDGAGGANEGSAYVFTRTGAVWTQQQKLVAGDAAASDRMGYSVAVDGDTALVGATDFFALDQGSTYVFKRTGTAWTEQDELVPASASINAKFGYRVAVSGSLGLVGARRDDTSAGVQSGSAWLFHVGCQPDFNVDNVVDGPDLAFLLAAWGSSNPFADLNGDGGVDGSDLAGLLATWGACN